MHERLCACQATEFVLGPQGNFSKYKSVSDYPVSDHKPPTKFRKGSDKKLPVKFRKIGGTGKGKENENAVTVSIGNPFGEVNREADIVIY